MTEQVGLAVPTAHVLFEQFAAVEKRTVGSVHPTAPEQEHDEQVAAGALRPAPPVNTTLVPEGHDGALPPPIVNSTGPVQPGGAAATQESPVGHAGASTPVSGAPDSGAPDSAGPESKEDASAPDSTGSESVEGASTG